MNRAFTHADDANDVTVAYYAASQMLVFTAEQFGMRAIREALRLWGEGVQTPQVIARAFGLPAAEYDARFKAWVLSHLSRYKGQFLFVDREKPLADAEKRVEQNPNDAEAHAALALSALKERKGDQAKGEISRAIALDPANKNARYIAAKIALAEHDAGAAATHLRAIKAAGGDGYTVQMAFAEIAQGKKDSAALRTALTRAYAFDPSQSEPLKGLLSMAAEEKRDDEVLSLLRKIAPLEQHDRRTWRALLDKLVARSMWEEARNVGEAAIFVDVESASTHVLYARALAAVGDHDKAVFELESALACAPPAKEAALAHALLARESLALKKVDAARTHRAEALRLDPGSAEAKSLNLP